MVAKSSRALLQSLCWVVTVAILFMFCASPVAAQQPNGNGQNWTLYGPYAFLFQGFVDNPNGQGARYQTVSIGSFIADGNGNITGGRFFVNDGSGNANNANLAD